MQEPKWNELQSLRDWAATLQQLLRAAELALRTNQRPERDQVRRWLQEYARRSPFRFQATAVGAAAALSNSLIDQAIKDIETRSLDLLRLVASLNLSTGELKRADRQLNPQMNKVALGLSYATNAIRVWQEAQRELQGLDASAFAKVKTALEALADLQQMVNQFKKDFPGR
jgi:hypothetical protein